MINAKYFLTPSICNCIEYCFNVKFPTKMIRKCGTWANLVLQWIGTVNKIMFTSHSQVTGNYKTAVTLWTAEHDKFMILNVRLVFHFTFPYVTTLYVWHYSCITNSTIKAIKVHNMLWRTCHYKVENARIIKTNEMHYFTNLFWYRTLHSMK